MYKILLILKVKNFEAFEQYEIQALGLLGRYRGKLLSAMETERKDDGSGEEIHLLEFQRFEDFVAYRQDPALRSLAELRSSAISATDVKPVLTEKAYPLSA